ncbi:MAG: SEC-C domain-containing protein [Myxococcales bacterium]|nr:SEC-C domain-containing protein [Myxococcales bacterium]
MARMSGAPEAPAEPAKPIVEGDEPCPCGSGEPFKQCHGEFL